MKRKEKRGQSRKERTKEGALINDLSFWENVYRTFIAENRYLDFLAGLQVTLTISLLAMILGVLIGMAVAFCKLSTFSFPFFRWKIRPLQWFANVYIDVLRGTPVVTQLLIIYFIVFRRVEFESFFVAAIGFGLNSGAYVAEIIRAGILSIDQGQTEAGRSLGLSRFQTMRFIVLPQAVKNILPALGNELIVLIKETAVAGYLPIVDLNKVAQHVQSRTYDFVYPLMGAAIIYYCIIKLLTFFLSRFEKRLRRADAR